ncbi:hypothetical protein P171DRAFT_495656 [Karstenula rhodostoma CBS 690.94]|uniref:Uncharacterized protein n=1 Tax=Karstenula rhodostoma CBS 690.94 TaxID=1392251 RepID=A0A9P4PGZ0_9PLEO|nr:hypothetical protein P171DRAFT_495656 [Karstenula rhodostoma CBS 690.94]
MPRYPVPIIARRHFECHSIAKSSQPQDVRGRASQQRHYPNPTPPHLIQTKTLQASSHAELANIPTSDPYHHASRATPATEEASCYPTPTPYPQATKPSQARPVRPSVRPSRVQCVYILQSACSAFRRLFIPLLDVRSKSKSNRVADDETGAAVLVCVGLAPLPQGGGQGGHTV